MARCSDFQRLLLLISEDITEEQLSKMKFLCDKLVSKSKLEKISKATDLFRELQEKEILSEFDTTFLESLLEDVAEKSLRQKLLDFKESHSSPGQLAPNGTFFVSYLPCELKHFLGREATVNDIVSALTERNMRIVFVIAPPGFGKSSVATHAGHVIYKAGNASVLHVTLRKQESLAAVCIEIIRCLERGRSPNSSDDPVLQTKNRLVGLERSTVLILDNAEDLQLSSSGADFRDFVEFLGERAANLQIILTSRQDFRRVNVHVHKIHLPALDSTFASKLLTELTPAHRRWACELGKLCGGVPLFLHLAACLLKDGFSCKVLVEELRRKGPTAVLKCNADMEDFYLTLLFFFERVNNKGFLKTLVKLSVFPTTFTAADASFLFKDRKDCECLLSTLVGSALLQRCDRRHVYEMHPLIQSFCRTERKKLRLEEQGRQAEESFNRHYLECLQRLHRDFVSKNGAQAAIGSFRRKQQNIMQAVKDSLGADQPSSPIKEGALDVCTEVVNFFAKVLQPTQFHDLYQGCLTVTADLGDEIRQSECLVSLGFGHLLDVNHRKSSREALEYFQRAYSIRVRSAPSQRFLECEVHAHCESKLGLCRVLDGDMTGRRSIEHAIELRKKLGDPLMIAAGYCDLGITYKIKGDHKRAISLWQKHTLVVYRKHLGKHPWVATILNYIADGYHALGKLDQAVEFKKEALSLREKLLGNAHQDTARSQFQLAKIYIAQRKLAHGLEVLQRILKLQEQNLGVHQDTVDTMSEMAEVMRRLGQVEDAAHMCRRAAKSKDTLKRRVAIQRKLSGTVEQCFARSRTASKSCLVVMFIFVLVYFFLVVLSPRGLMDLKETRKREDL